jgi:hypothetical protein
VRLGTRTANPRIAGYSLEAYEMVDRPTRYDRALNVEFRNLKALERELRNLVDRVTRNEPHGEEVLGHIESYWPEQHIGFERPPEWVKALYEDFVADGERGFAPVSKTKTGEDAEKSLFGFWKRADDLIFLESITRKDKLKEQREGATSANRFTLLVSEEKGKEDKNSKKKQKSKLDIATSWLMHMTIEDSPEHEIPKEETENPEVDDECLAFLLQHGMDTIPQIPATTRTLEELLTAEYLEIWAMSKSERTALAAFWSNDLMSSRDSVDHEDFKNLRKKLEMSKMRYDALKDEVRAHPPVHSDEITEKAYRRGYGYSRKSTLSDAQRQVNLGYPFWSALIIDWAYQVLLG